MGLVFHRTGSTAKRLQCTSRESNPGLPRGRREFYHWTTSASEFLGVASSNTLASPRGKNWGLRGKLLFEPPSTVLFCIKIKNRTNLRRGGGGAKVSLVLILLKGFFLTFIFPGESLSIFTVLGCGLVVRCEFLSEKAAEFRPRFFPDALLKVFTCHDWKKLISRRELAQEFAPVSSCTGRYNISQVKSLKCLLQCNICLCR